MRTRVALLAAGLALGGVAAVPARAWLPSYCNIVATQRESRAMVTYTGSPAAAARTVEAAGGRVVGRITALRALQVSFGTGTARDAALGALRAAPGVVAAEPERVFAAHRTPNDPYLSRQWGAYKIGLPKVWDRETGSRSPVTVAVLDTGVDLRHPDLLGRVSAGKNVVANNDDPSDDHGHGTHVAGIVGARTNNRAGVAGVTWAGNVLAVKVLGGNGEGSDCDVALGIVLASDAGAKVLNLSLGADSVVCGVVTQAAVDYARRAGAVPVASAGNSAAQGNPTASPANCRGVLAVGATDPRDRIAKFSSHHPYVGVSAPGVAIMSTGYDPRRNRRTYVAWSGTSMAAPYVSGVAALLLSKHPAWTPDEVVARITSTADDRGPRGRDEYYGFGRVNAARALG